MGSNPSSPRSVRSIQMGIESLTFSLNIDPLWDRILCLSTLNSPCSSPSHHGWVKLSLSWWIPSNQRISGEIAILLHFADHPYNPSSLCHSTSNEHSIKVNCWIFKSLYESIRRMLDLGMATGRGGHRFRYLIPIPVKICIHIPIPKPNRYQTFSHPHPHRVTGIILYPYPYPFSYYFNINFN